MAGPSSEEQTEPLLSPMKQPLKNIKGNGSTQDTARIARMRVNIISIGDIDTVKEEFRCDLVLTVMYEEPDIKGLAEKDIDWDKVWNPRIRFFNAVKEDKYEVKKRRNRDNPRDAQLTIKMMGVFKSSMTLKDFPFDNQDLKIEIMSDQLSEHISFRKDIRESTVRTDTFAGEQEWELQKYVIAHEVQEKEMKEKKMQEEKDQKKKEQEEKRSTKEKRKKNIYPRYRFTVNVKRRPHYYLYNIAGTMSVITPLALSAYAVDAPTDRLSITITTMAILLTAISFKFALARNLPITSHLTLLDFYLFWVMAFQILVISQTAIATCDWFPKAFDMNVWIVFLVLHFLITIIFIIIACCKSRKVSRKMMKHEDEYNIPCKDSSDSAPDSK